ncbi:MAG: zinc ribbon domain-containing protein [Candidatus Latescibacteria bacterium]|nr:zinc ribbon domain-containing protein [Candidatus Latescibacterota bacterium]
MLTGLLKCDECGGSYVMTGGRRASGKTKYYRCSYHANRGNAVCTNKRSVRQDAVETAVLEAVSERLLTPETVEAILEEARALILEDEPDGQVEETRKALEKIGKEIRNLTLGIRAAGPVDELVKELRACELRRDSLRAEIEALLQVEPAGLGDISTEEIEEGLMNLKHTLSYATPREVKSLLQEHIQAIRIPPKGNAQLVFNPAGLLEYYISLVTPRGVEPPSPE